MQTFERGGGGGSKILSGKIPDFVAGILLWGILSFPIFGTHKIWGILSGGNLSPDNFSLRDFVMGDYVVGDFVKGGFCHGGFCLTFS